MVSRDLAGQLLDDGLRLRTEWFTLLTTQYPQARGMFPPGTTAMPQWFLDAVVWTVDGVGSGGWDGVVDKRLRELALDLRRTGFPSHEYPAAAALLAQAVEGEAGEVIAQAGEVMAEAAGAADLEGVPAASAVQVTQCVRQGEVTVVRCEAGASVSYEPGQSLPVMQVGRQGVWRGLTPAMPANAFGQLEFHVDGELDAQALAPGEWLTLGGARGAAPKLGGGRVLLVADGTGLAAAKCLVFDLLERAEKPQVHLVVGAKRQADVYDVATFAALAGAQEWLDVTWVVEAGTTDDWRAAGLAPVRHLYAPLPQAVAGAGMWWGREIVICAHTPRALKIADAMRAHGAPEPTVLSPDAGFDWSL